MLRVHVEEDADAELAVELDEICRRGGEADAGRGPRGRGRRLRAAFTEERDEHGHRLVVRNGHAEPRSLVTGAGPIEVRAPRVDDRRVDEVTGERCAFASSIMPPWCRKSPKVAEVLPLCTCTG